MSPNRDNVLDLISQITEFNDLHSFMKDDHLDNILAYIVNLIVKPDISPALATKLIVELQAYGAKMSIMATYYSTIRKGPAGSVDNNKKNIYYTVANAIDRVVDSLKYAAKHGV